MVRELRGGRNHSRRARRRGSGARAEPISERHCVRRSVEEKNVFVFGAGEGGAYDVAALAGPGFFCLPCAGMKAKRMSSLCGIRRAHELL